MRIHNRGETTLFVPTIYNGAFANCRRRLYFANKKGGSGDIFPPHAILMFTALRKRGGEKKETAVFQASGEVWGGGPRAAAMLTLFFRGKDVFEER